MNTRVNTKPFKIKIEKGAFAVAKRKGLEIEAKAKKNMDPLYMSNSPWSYRGLANPGILSESRSGLARASIHSWWNTSEMWVRIGSTANVMKAGVEGIAGSSVFYFPYLEYGTHLMPPLGMLRKAFDEVRRG